MGGGQNKNALFTVKWYFIADCNEVLGISACQVRLSPEGVEFNRSDPAQPRDQYPLSWPYKPCVQVSDYSVILLDTNE